MQIKIGHLSISTQNSTVKDEAKAAFYFLILCRPSLERYRRKKGVEVKVHCVLRYEETVNHIWLCNRSLLNFLTYQENLISFFISVYCKWASGSKVFGSGRHFLIWCFIACGTLLYTYTLSTNSTLFLHFVHNKYMHLCCANIYHFLFDSFKNSSESMKLKSIIVAPRVPSVKQKCRRYER